MVNISSKELTAISDQLGVEQNLIKKYKMYAQASSDPQIKGKCSDIANKHQSHYDKLLSHLG